jgi:hypothetical protein
MKDVMTIDKNLAFKDSFTLKNAIGGLLSLLFYCLSIFFVFLMEKKLSTAVISNYNYPWENSTTTMVPLIFIIPKNGSLLPNLFRTDIDTNKTVLNECSPQQYSLFFTENHNVSNFYICDDVFLFNIKNYYTYTFQMCDNSPASCTGLNSVDFLFITEKINNKTLDFSKEIISGVITNFTRIYFDSTKLSDDIGWFNTDIKEFYFPSLTQFYESKNSDVLKLNIRKSNNKVTSRYYAKIYLILALYFSNVIFSYFVLRYISSFYADFIFYQYILKKICEHNLSTMRENLKNHHLENPTVNFYELSDQVLTTHLIKIYSFKNYMMSLFSKSNKTFLIITEGIKYQIHLRNLLTEEDSTFQLISRDNKPLNFLERIDILSQEKSFFKGSSQSLVMPFGVFLTYILGVIFFYFLCHFTIPVLLRLEPNISIYNFYKTNMQTDPLYFLNVPLLVEISNELLSSSNLIFQYNNKNSMFDYKKCDSSELRRFNITSKENLSYLCSNLNNTPSDVIQLTLFNCDISETGLDSRCKKSKNITDYYFNIYVMSTSLDTTNFENPLSHSFLNSKMTSESKGTQFATTLTDIKFINDQNIFFSNSDITYLTEVNSFTKNILKKNYYSQIQFTLDLQRRIINRLYKKLPEAIAIAMNCTKLVGGFIYIMYISYSNFSYFNMYKVPFFRNCNAEEIRKNMQELKGVNEQTNIFKYLNKKIIKFKIHLFASFYYLTWGDMRKKVKLYKYVYKHFKKLFSLENLVFRSYGKKSVKPENGKKNLIIKFLKTSDIFGQKAQFYINSLQVYKTKAGGIISIIFVFCSLSLGIFLAYFNWFNAMPSISVFTQSLDYGTQGFVEIDIPFAFAVNDIESLKNTTSEVVTNKTNTFFVNSKECTDQEYFTIYGNEVKNVSKTYFCSNTNKYIKQTPEIPMAAFNYYLFTCQNLISVGLKDPTCFDFSPKNITLEIESLYSNLMNFDETKKVFLAYNLLKYNRTIKLKDILTIDITMKSPIVTRTRLRLYNNLLISTVKETSFMAPTGTSKGYYVANLQISSGEETVITVAYPTLSDFLNLISGNLSLLYLVATTINNLINEYLYYNFLLSILFKKINFEEIEDPQKRTQENVAIRRIKTKNKVGNEKYFEHYSNEIFRFKYYLLHTITGGNKYFTCGNQNLKKYNLTIKEIKEFSSVDGALEYALNMNKNIEMGNFSNLSHLNNLNNPSQINASDVIIKPRKLGTNNNESQSQMLKNEEEKVLGLNENRKNMMHEP